MRYLNIAIVSLCCLSWTILGCDGQTPQSEGPQNEENAPSTESAPDADPQSPAKGEEGFNLDIDIGEDGVRVETEGEGDSEKRGVEVDVTPEGQVDVNVKEKTDNEIEEPAF